jgi:hypothetical protein
MKGSPDNGASNKQALLPYQRLCVLAKWHPSGACAQCVVEARCYHIPVTAKHTGLAIPESLCKHCVCTWDFSEKLVMLHVKTPLTER